MLSKGEQKGEGVSEKSNSTCVFARHVMEFVKSSTMASLNLTIMLVTSPSLATATLPHPDLPSRGPDPSPDPCISSHGVQANGCVNVNTGGKQVWYYSWQDIFVRQIRRALCIRTMAASTTSMADDIDVDMETTENRFESGSDGGGDNNVTCNPSVPRHGIGCKYGEYLDEDGASSILDRDSPSFRMTGGDYSNTAGISRYDEVGTNFICALDPIHASPWSSRADETEDDGEDGESNDCIGNQDIPGFLNFLEDDHNFWSGFPALFSYPEVHKEKSEAFILTHWPEISTLITNNMTKWVSSLNKSKYFFAPYGSNGQHRAFRDITQENNKIKEDVLMKYEEKTSACYMLIIVEPQVYLVAVINGLSREPSWNTAWVQNVQQFLGKLKGQLCDISIRL